MAWQVGLQAPPLARMPSGQRPAGTITSFSSDLPVEDLPHHQANLPVMMAHDLSPGAISIAPQLADNDAGVALCQCCRCHSYICRLLRCALAASEKGPLQPGLIRHRPASISL